MCSDVCEIMHGFGSGREEHLIINNGQNNIVPCCFVNWSPLAPKSATDGLVQGLGGFVQEVGMGITNAIYDPVKGNCVVLC
jgi:hypothetical protein